jgi:glycerophosphoryl diester phosphodiesterase
MFGISERTLVIGHRGGAGAAPENTLESIRHGVEAGADAIEFDIHATRDDRLVLFHDDTLERTTDGTGVVEEMTLEELRRLDAGHGFTPDFGRSYPFRGRGIRIPTLDEAVEACGDLPMICEIKTAKAGLLLAEWLPGKPARERMIVGGFDLAQVRPAAAVARWRCASRRDLTPMVLLGKLGIPAKLPTDVSAAMVPVRKGAVRVVTRDFIRRCHATGAGVHVWTVNRPDEMRALLALGVDGLISDCPAIARRIVEERRAGGEGLAAVPDPVPDEPDTHAGVQA